jgi:SAM-dependent methyltransferase
VIPQFPSRAARDGVRELLDSAGYREDRVGALFGARSLPETRRRLVLERNTPDGSSLGILVRLFLGGFELARRELDASLGSASVKALEEARLIEPSAAGLRPTVQLTPTRSLVIASDRFDRHRTREADFVLGVGPVSGLLANLTIRRPVESTLDLGCGSGVLGLLAAAHSRRVVAVDLNPRAVQFTRFNADLNGLDNLEAAGGDLFAPVHGQRFDLIVCNPPYVLSPDSTFLYRDGGGTICERIAREAPAHLTDGGCLQLLCNWPEVKGRDWRAAVARWLEGSGCDAWVLRQESLDAATYAMVWLTQEFPEQQIPPDSFRGWVTHLESMGVESVGAGLLVMRPVRSRAPWLEIRDSPPISEGAGESIARTFAARDLAARLGSNEELLRARLRPSPDLEQRQRERATGEGWEHVARELRLVRGLCFAARVDPVAAALVGLLDGRRTLGDAVDLFAESQGVPPEMFLEDLPRAIRPLLDLGLLIPAGEETERPTEGLNLASPGAP